MLMKYKYTKRDLELIRSDMGDGGWSLHLRGDEDEDGMPNNVLLSGESKRSDSGEWLRPNKEDYEEALSMVFHGMGSRD